MINLENKVVVITGGCGFLGSTFVKAVLEHNGRVVIADLDKEAGNRQLLTLAESGVSQDRILFSETSINNIHSVERLIEETHLKFGKIDALLNNAHPRNSNYSKVLDESSYDAFCENLTNHLGGYFLCMQQFSKYFVKQGFGNIISMSSIYGVVAPRFDIYEEADFTMPVDYAPIKSGIIHLTNILPVTIKTRTFVLIASVRAVFSIISTLPLSKNTTGMAPIKAC